MTKAMRADNTETTSGRQLYASLVFLRLANALLCVTFFQPDEYYQSLEIAHRIVFGYGYQTWEWQRASRIRSPLYAFLFVPGYFLVKMMGLEQTRAFAFVAAAIDYQTYQLARKVTDRKTAKVALSLSLLSLFNAYVSVRTFSNSLETALTAATLTYWPWQGSMSASIDYRNLLTPLSLAALTCIIRPSNAFIWLFLGFRLLQQISTLNMQRLLISVLACGTSAITLCFAIDTLFYGQPTLTILQFFRFNIWQGHSSFYGIMSWHYYFVQALPILLFNQLPFFLVSVYRILYGRESPPILQTFLGCTIFTMLAYSLVAHKEVRFAQPLTPMLSVITAGAIAPKNHDGKSKVARITGLSPRLFLFLAVSSLLPATYLLRIHGRGLIQVMEHLQILPATELQSVIFLMPCHSTPWQSHLHRSDLDFNSTQGQSSKLRALTCEPPIGYALICHCVVLNIGSVSNSQVYKDESEIFYADPASFLERRFFESNDPISTSQGNFAWPTHFVLFENLLQAGGNQSDLATILLKRGYKEERRIANGHWQEDPRRSGQIVILKREF